MCMSGAMIHGMILSIRIEQVQLLILVHMRMDWFCGRSVVVDGAMFPMYVVWQAAVVSHLTVASTISVFVSPNLAMDSIVLCEKEIEPYDTNDCSITLFF